ncbi:hypothetical protein PZN02_006356 (plasmid) [Sinorhizobium garamanticum]|uniref:Uncharacterized protein n=1 Tax=Sinorhizobium garamanticum TaxID=680247 RepID=A0ABY8DKV1_9HYPH|nr:hypothetical protein [Sinorhizobium garamanticum]WEX91536.1 hypothetical protein PZN02_006356 [Sinorhizobium garamanticum]
MEVALINIIGICLFLGAGVFIGIIGHLVIKDFPLMRRDSNYMSFFFSQRKTHARLLITLSLFNVVLFITIFTLIGL